jgi:D-alanyl-D-alanine carboxypeptidase
LEGSAEGHQGDGKVRVLLLALAALVTAAAVGAPAPRNRVKSRAAKPAKVVKAAKPAAGPAITQYRKLPYVGAISADAANGNILFADNADAIAYPASVTKLMTALLVIEDVKASRYSFSTEVVATPEAYQSESSWVGIKAGEKMTVDDLLMALMVMSANDAANVLGVNSAGSLEAFVKRMNARAGELGMSKTEYYNPSGLPPNAARRYPWKKFNRTTASDQLKLAMEILKHPEILRYSSAKTATVKDGSGKDLWMRNHNRILRMDKFHIYNPDGTEAVDGLKTGYINAGGSSIVLTGTRSGKRAIVVVLGSASSDALEEAAAKLMRDALGAIAW